MAGGAVAVMNISGALRGAHVETAYQNTLNQLRFARQVAIDKRTVCRVDFAAPGRISVTQAFADGTPVQSETVTLRRMSNTPSSPECLLHLQPRRTTSAMEKLPLILTGWRVEAGQQYFSNLTARR